MDNEADLRWLLAGAFAGLVLAAYGILRQSSAGAPLPDDAVAMVNDTMISRDVFERALARLALSDSAAGQKARLLRRLVDDELLVQRGVELGMTESDTDVRNAIVNSLVATVTAEADAASPDKTQLEQYLTDNAERFSFTSSLHVEAWQTEKEPLAQDFVAALRAGIGTLPGDDIKAMPDLPPGMLPLDVLRNYLGPAITAAAADMPDGSSAVFASRGRWLVIRVLAKERNPVTDIDTIRNRVLLDYRRNLADGMLRRYLDNLRQRANIRGIEP